MKKIPTIFSREDSGRRHVLAVLVAGCESVIEGAGVATRKRDGTATMVDSQGRLWKRYDAKKGKAPPAQFNPCQDPDPITGHWPGWVPVGEGPEDQWFRSVVPPTEPGTYEFCGPKVQGNAERLTDHAFFRHGAELLTPFEDLSQPLPVMVAFATLRAFLEQHAIEGIVWHIDGNPFAKIKRRDFGIPWPVGA